MNAPAHNDAAELIRQLRERRMSLGIKRLTLAGQIGVNYGQLRKLELGINAPSIELFCRLAEALDLKVRLEMRME